MTKKSNVFLFQELPFIIRDKIIDQLAEKTGDSETIGLININNQKPKTKDQWENWAKIQCKFWSI